MTEKIHDDITTAVGGTPLVRLNRLTEGLGARVLAKLEFYSPAASVKDRIGVAMVDAAEAAGALKPGGTIIEGTSGNTGIALALVGAARGYKVVLVMSDTASMERRVLLRAYGAELVLVPGSVGMTGTNEKVKELVAATPGAVWARQFANEANPEIHYRTTGQEIWDDTDGHVDMLVAGVGTGGTITGAGRLLREKNPDVRIVAVEPSDSPLLSGGQAGPHKIQGLGANFVPDVLDTGIYDEVAAITFEDAVATARGLSASEGILSGISGGAATAAALTQAGKAENADKTIVVVIPDFGERYVSTALYADLTD